MPKTPLFPLPEGLEIISLHEGESHLDIHILSKRIRWDWQSSWISIFLDMGTGRG